MSQCFGGSLWREDGLRKTGRSHRVLVARVREKMVPGRHIRGTEVTAFRCLALARRLFSGVVCKWYRSYRVASVGAKLVFGSRVLMREKYSVFGGSLIREYIFRGSCVGEIETGALWLPASARM